MSPNDFKKGDIKYHVLKYIEDNKSYFNKKKVLDFPAGNGFTSQFLKQNQAEPFAFDVFPEYFKIEEIKCYYSDIQKRIELDENAVDCIICQEGIEHFQDQAKTINEFNRVLKTNGKLIITTPNQSNLRSRLSFLFTESEHFKKIMPVNEYDSIWKSDSVKSEIYFGHVFLITASKLRLLSKLAGFELKKIHKTELNSTSIILFPIIYPFVFVSSTLLYFKNKRKNKTQSDKIKVFKELYKMMINPRILTYGHLFFELEKTENLDDVLKKASNVHQEFGQT
jgi:ubiquinone/menaquinone biosynthesis C-methylase UbiE